jgi:hypothetical protein
MRNLPAVAIAALVSTICIHVVTPAVAGEQTVTTAAAPATKDVGTIDCSKEVWPNFPPACLRNAQATEVRMVTMNRR